MFKNIKSFFSSTLFKVLLLTPVVGVVMISGFNCSPYQVIETSIKFAAPTVANANILVSDKTNQHIGHLVTLDQSGLLLYNDQVKKMLRFKNSMSASSSNCGDGTFTFDNPCKISGGKVEYSYYLRLESIYFKDSPNCNSDKYVIADDGIENQVFKASDEKFYQIIPGTLADFEPKQKYISNKINIAMSSDGPIVTEQTGPCYEVEESSANLYFRELYSTISDQQYYKSHKYYQIEEVKMANPIPDILTTPLAFSLPE
ncbi:MAG: hypothetical protein HOO06_14305 [Bdellovibrionaceae bacterium]|jgi:hypothetical protein|nr:hypothetical protein [Pseudobdellovibrionaceae bacterium]